MKFKLAVVQMTSALESEKNIEKLKPWLKEAKAKGAQAVFLPECFYSMSDGITPTSHLVDEQNKDCPHLKNIKNLGRESGVSLIGGSAATLVSGGKIINRVYNIDADGELLPFYDKRKLFACRLKGKSITESDIYTPGDKPLLLDFSSLKIGIGVCFDIRFSELAKDYRDQGANMLTYSAAFTVPTGKAHWHILNRARAIESQSFVVSSAQWGRHNERISTYGHSLVIDPWGEVLLDAGEREGIFITEIDLDQIEKVRQSVLMNP